MNNHTTWWDNLPSGDRSVLKDVYGVSLLAHEGEILRIYNAEVATLDSTESDEQK